MRRHRLYGIALSCTPEPGTRSRTGSFPDWPLGPMQLACENANQHAPMNRSTPSFSYAPRRQWVFLVVPAFGLLQDGRTYFNFHHTAADTLDKIVPQELRENAAALAVMGYALAMMPEPLPR